MKQQQELERLISIEKNVKLEYQGSRDTSRRIFPKGYSREVVEYMMEYGIGAVEMGGYINMYPQNINRWIVKHRSMKKNKIAYLHGTRPRMDIATQCKAVKSHIEKGVTLQTLSEEYHVSPQTINNWTKRYSSNYQHYIDTLEPGVTQIKENKKLIFGEASIQDIVKFKENQIVELDLALELNHKYGLNKNGLAQMEKKGTKTREELDALNRALDIMELC